MPDVRWLMVDYGILTRNKETIHVPSYANEIVIAELEQEETFIEEIRGGDFDAKGNIHLRQGDVFSAKVEPLTTLYITGYYVPNTMSHGLVLDPWRRNEVIVRFLQTAS